MQILPNGRVKISNFQTGESKEIDPSELPRYGGTDLFDQYIKLKSLDQSNQVNPLNVANTQLDISRKTQELNTNNQPNPLSGTTPITLGGTNQSSYQKAYQSAKTIDEQKKISTEFKNANGYELFGQPKPTPANTTLPPISNPDQAKFQQAFKNAKTLQEQKTISDNFKGAYGYELFGQSKNTSDQQKAAKLKNDTLQAAIAVKTVLDNKSKYGSEKAYNDALKYASSRLSSATGFGEGGKVLSGAELGILSGSLINIKPQGRGNPWQRFMGEVPAATGDVLDDEATIKNKMDNAIGYLTTGKLPNPGSYKKIDSRMVAGTNVTMDENTRRGKEIVNSIIPDIKSQVQGIAKLPGVVSTIAKNPSTLPKIGVAMGKGIIDSYKNVLGNPEYARQHPVEAAEDLVPLLSFIGKFGKVGVLGKAAEEINSAGKATNVISKAGIGEDIAGRAATTALKAPNMGSVIKSENLLKQALQNTTSNTPRGMARELELSIPEQGRVIDNHVSALDQVIGPQPLDEVVTQIISKVADTVPARANPEMLVGFEKTIRKLLTDSQLEGGMAKGEAFATSFNKMNEARKYLTSKKDAWFKAGQPVGDKTNDLNAMDWEGANAIKDIMAEADNRGVIKNALNKQHVAFSTYPVISEQVLQDPKFANSIIGTLRNIAGTATTVPRMAGARALQGEKSLLPSIEAGASAKLAPKTSLPPITTPLNPARKPLDSNIIDSVISKKGEAQGLRLTRDMRYKQGEPQFRGEQEKVLQKASKKRFK